MTTRVALEAGFLELLVRLIGESDDNDPPCQRTGESLSCSQPLIGRWIDDCDFPFLMDTLALPDSVFSEEFPGIRLSHEEREAFARLLKMHCTECARCNAKQAEDVAWKVRVDKIIAKNKHTIAAILADETYNS